MSKIAIITIAFYQIFVSPLLKIILGNGKFCRFSETCSDYTKRMICEKGVIKGVWFGAIRLLKCQPFYNGAY